LKKKNPIRFSYPSFARDCASLPGWEKSNIFKNSSFSSLLEQPFVLRFAGKGPRRAKKF
jgi:hypothetical protein